MTDLLPVASPEQGEATASETPDDFEAEETQSDTDAFQERVNRLVGMIAHDPAIRDRMIAETYVTIAEFSESLREMQASMGSMGPAAFMRSMFTGGMGG